MGSRSLMRTRKISTVSNQLKLFPSSRINNKKVGTRPIYNVQQEDEYHIQRGEGFGLQERRMNEYN